jgi:hypothetical protein
MSRQVREEMIALGSAGVNRERLTGYIEALGKAAVFLSCDSRITQRDECGSVLRATRQQLLALKVMLSGLRDEFDEQMEVLTR